ncbi:hypothetical protein FHS84_002467 [Rhizomicrobium electricum]|nr:hypothetical protein [Rhizomicrobium electricum]
MAYKAQMIENLLGMKRARFGESMSPWRPAPVPMS